MLEYIFKSSFNCKLQLQFPTDIYSSFELQNFVLNFDLAPCALIYKDCIQDFVDLDSMDSMDSMFSSQTTDEFGTVFNSTCAELLDTVAPFRTDCSKPLTESWLNETTCTDLKENI